MRATAKAKPANRGYGDPKAVGKGGAKASAGTAAAKRQHDPAKHPRDERGRFASKGGGTGAAKMTTAKPAKPPKVPKPPKPPAKPKPPKKVGTPKQRKGLADQVRAAKATAKTPEARRALLTQVRDLRAKRAEWKRGQGKTQVERLPKPPKPVKPPKEKAPKPPKEPKPKKEKVAKKPSKEAGPKPPGGREPASLADDPKIVGRVREEIARLKAEFAPAKARLAEAEAKLAGLSNMEKHGHAGDAARVAVRDAFREADAIAERGKRFKAWEAEVKSNPNLIPPFEMPERLAIYAARGGQAKVDALAKLAPDTEKLKAQLAGIQDRRDVLVKKMFEAQPKTPEHREAMEALTAVNVERRRLETELAAGAPPPDRVAAAIRPRGKTLEVEAVQPTKYEFGLLDPAQQPTVDAGLNFIRDVTADAGIGGLKVPVGKVVASSASDRSHCTRDGIALEAGAGPDVMVHEFGHYLEYHSPGAGASALDFLNHRVGNETPRSMKDVSPQSRYKDNELGRKDRFDQAFDEHQAYYVGKDYGKGGSEIMAMGTQKLYKDAANFAKKDPEYAMFTLAVLDGSFRR